MNDDLSPVPALLPSARPRLSAGARLQADRLTGRTVLLFPEGLLQLNATGAAILELCDGCRSMDEVVGALAEKFATTPQVLGADVADYLRRLQQRRLVTWADPAPLDIASDPK